MDYKFFPLKIYFGALIILMLLFVCIWLPEGRVELFIFPEPLITSFEVKLDKNARENIFNLNILPIKIVDYSERDVMPEWQFIDDLKNDKTNEIIVFKKRDLEDLIVSQVNFLLNESEQSLKNEFEIKKEVIKYHPENWQIKVVKKDFLNGFGVINVFLQEEAIKRYDFERIKQEVKFKNMSFIKSKIEDIFGLGRAIVNVWPKFWPKNLFFPGRIKFLLKTLDNV